MGMEEQAQAREELKAALTNYVGVICLKSSPASRQQKVYEILLEVDRLVPDQTPTPERRREPVGVASVASYAPGSSRG